MGEYTRDETPTALAPEALARALFEQSPFSCVIYDSNGVPLAVNAAFTRLMGISLAEMPPDYSVLRDQQLANTGVLPLIRRAFEGESVTLPPVRYEASVYGDQGRTTWTQAQLYPIRGENGDVVQVVLVHTDLTQRIEAEDALRVSERELSGARLRLEAILNAVSDGITVQDTDRTIVYANTAAAQLIGFATAEELLGSPVADVIARFEMRDDRGAPFPPERLPSERAMRGEAAPEDLVNYVVRATGEEHWNLVRARAIRSSDGTLELVVNAFHDVTERVLQQRALEDTAGRLEELATEQEQTLEELRVRSEEAEAARDAAEWAEERSRFLADAGRILASSVDYETTLRTVVRLAVPRIADWCTVHIVDDEIEVRRLEVAHADPERLEAARELEERYPPDPENSAVHRVVRTGTAEIHPEIPEALLEQSATDAEHLRLLRELGLRSAMIVPLIAHHRTLGALTLIAAESDRRYDESDLTFAENLASRAALSIHTATLYNEAQEANLAKSKFLAVMSHELRTPLNAILGYADLLTLGIGGTLSQQQTDHLTRISQSAQHLTQLIETVLTFARVDAGREEVHHTELDLAQLTKDAIALVAPAAAARSLSIDAEVDEPVRIRSDIAKVRQILLNLLSNAVKFTEEGGVKVQVRRSGDNALVVVTDTGIGIPEEDQSRIWEPFTQLDPELTRTTGGTGLGLPVSANLAELLGGRIDLVSAAGKGSTFTLCLPART